MKPLTLSELLQFEILAHVQPDALEKLRLEIEQRTLAASECLLAAERHNTTLYLVRSGSFGVHLVSPESPPITVLRRGESVGELSVLDGRPTSAHVIALERSEVLAIPEASVWTLLAHSHAFAVNLLLKLGDRLREQNRTLSEQIERREKAAAEAANLDPVTDAHNRRWLDATLSRWVSEHARTGAPLSILLVDVDELKAYNDRYGHRAGDAVLRETARTMRGVLRQGDRVARYGGDEFVVLLPDTDLARGRATAERLRMEMDRREVTLSMGVAQLRGSQGPAELLDAADAALYRAKTSGRNRVCTTED